jgi:hypothetical protein
MRTLLVCVVLAFAATAAPLEAAVCPGKSCRSTAHKRTAAIAAPTATPAAGVVIWRRSDGTTEVIEFGCRVREDGWYWCELP